MQPDEVVVSRGLEKPAERPGLLRRLLLSQFVLADETAYFPLVNAFDFFVTYVLLVWPGSPVHEANPIARRMFSWGLGYLIAFKFGAATVSILCCEAVARRRRALGRTILILLTVIVGAVAVYGARLFVIHLMGR